MVRCEAPTDEFQSSLVGASRRVVVLREREENLWEQGMEIEDGFQLNDTRKNLGL